MNWRQHAACRHLPVHAAFTTSQREQRAYIAAHCDHCPVRQECLGEAMQAEATCRPSERFGIFGGLVAHHRAKLGKQAPTAIEIPPQLHPLIVAIMSAEDEERAARRQATAA